MLGLQFNWVDWVIVVVAGSFVGAGWYDGLLKQGLGLMTFLGSLWVAVRFHFLVGNFVAEKFGLPDVWANVLGYVVVGMATELVLAELAMWAVGRLPERWWKSWANRVLGAVVSAGQAMVVMAFVMLVVLVLPLRGTVKKDVRESRLGSALVRLAERYGGQVKSSLDRAAAGAVKFLTVVPGTRENLQLPVEPMECELREDSAAARAMLELVNQERARVSVRQLRVENKIEMAASAHSWDMWKRRYFSHYSLEGRDAVDRMETGGVRFSLAGENLAFAADVETAHRGLMGSAGHRKNILEPKFGRVGMGVVNGGVCGIMFVQNFAD